MLAPARESVSAPRSITLHMQKGADKRGRDVSAICEIHVSI